MRDMPARPQDFDWLGTRMEIARKIRTDAAFRDEWLARSAEPDSGDPVSPTTSAHRWSAPRRSAGRSPRHLPRLDHGRFDQSSRHRRVDREPARGPRPVEASVRTWVHPSEQTDTAKATRLRRVAIRFAHVPRSPRRTHPDKPAIIAPATGETVTHRQLDENFDAHCALPARHPGLVAGEVIAMVTDNDLRAFDVLGGTAQRHVRHGHQPPPDRAGDELHPRRLWREGLVRLCERRGRRRRIRTPSTGSPPTVDLTAGSPGAARYPGSPTMTKCSPPHRTNRSPISRAAPTCCTPPAPPVDRGHQATVAAKGRSTRCPTSSPRCSVRCTASAPTPFTFPRARLPRRAAAPLRDGQRARRHDDPHGPLRSGTGTAPHSGVRRHAQPVGADDVRAHAKLPPRCASATTSSMQAAIHAAAPCPTEVKRAMIDRWGPVVNEILRGDRSSRGMPSSAPRML